MSLRQAIVTDSLQETENTKKLLAAVPDGKLDWKPHEKSMTLGHLAGHLAETPSWIGAMLEDEMDFASMSQDDKPFVPTSQAEFLATLDENVAAFTAALAGRDDAFMRANWKMKKGDQVLMDEARHAVIRSTLIHHTAPHRGQLTVYLRLLDLPVPATYGSIADVSLF